MKKDIYFVGNAHLDPVWMWQWQEGSCEAKATIRSALDRIREYDDFIFVCSASAVFEWVEKYDPAMFDEIRQRVREGRFVLVGGMYIQPDCNLPGGESFARQTMYAQRYFLEKFGQTATIGYNVDSFGHNAMLPQILRKSGMDKYIFMRPSPTEKPMDGELFHWEAPDGSRVLASRLPRAYQTKYVNIDDLPHLEELVETMEKTADPDIAPMLFFYGVGNHGGGPTKKNIETIMLLQKNYPQHKLIFSDLYDYFRAVAQYADSLPVHRDDLQHHASGCYSALSSVKTQVRKAECAMFQWESLEHLANTLAGYPTSDKKAVDQAWKNILFAQFHDSLGGCSMKPAHDGIDLMLSESRSIAARHINDALQTLSWKIDTAEGKYGYPLILFNPNSFPVTQTVTVNKRTACITDEQGNRVPTQIVHSPTAMCRLSYGDTIFRATVPAMGYACYFDSETPYMAMGYTGGKPEVTPASEPGHQRLQSGYDFLENDHLRVQFDLASGNLKSIYDKHAQRELLRGAGGKPVVIDESAHDTWSHRLNTFDNEVGTFALSRITLIEEGPVRATMRVTTRYGSSVLRQYYSLTPDSSMLEVRVKLSWHETQKMLKLRFETNMEDPQVFYEIPYGVIGRPANGEEEPGLMWIAAMEKGYGLAIINDSKYSFSAKGGDVNLTAIRSPYYQDHGRGVCNEECYVTDQGDFEFSYAIRAFDETQGWHSLIRDGRSLNMPCHLVAENHHEGTLPLHYSGIGVSCDNVVISAIKPSENGKGLILRAYETDGKHTEAVIRGDALPEALHVTFRPFSVNTYYYDPAQGKWREVLMTECDT